MVFDDICRETPKSPSFITPWSFNKRFMVLGIYFISYNKSSKKTQSKRLDVSVYDAT